MIHMTHLLVSHPTRYVGHTGVAQVRYSAHYTPHWFGVSGSPHYLRLRIESRLNACAVNGTPSDWRKLAKMLNSAQMAACIVSFVALDGIRHSVRGRSRWPV